MQNQKLENLLNLALSYKRGENEIITVKRRV